MVKVLKKVSLKFIAQAGKFSSISKVRENTNGYKYVTFLKGSASSNIYFGQKSSDKVTVGEAVPVEMIKTADIILAVNEVGEERLKLALTGESQYQSVESLFDTTEDANLDVVAAFEESFSLRPVVMEAPEFESFEQPAPLKKTLVAV